MPEQIPFGGVNPVFRVQDVDASVDYYTPVLGFKVAFRTPGVASVGRGKCNIFLCEGDQGHPGNWVWIGVSDAAAVCKVRRSANGWICTANAGHRTLTAVGGEFRGDWRRSQRTRR